MSDDDFERQSGPSNPWGKPSGPRSSVPEIGRPEQAEAFRTDSAENRSAADSSGQTPPSRNGAIGKVYYDDSEGGLVPLAIKGHLLTLITLGIYRFWYLTNLRRFFWSHTRVHDSALEYTGRGMEIFIGFLIAMAVVVPLNFVPVFLTASLGPVGAIVAFFIPLLYFFLILFAIYRSRRYRVNRTLWRGVRCHQTGSGWGYALRALGWSFACLLSFGFCVPWALTDLYRYRVERMHLGAIAFSFMGDWRLIAKPYWVLWAIFALPSLAFLLTALPGADVPGFFGALAVEESGRIHLDGSKWSADGKWLSDFGPTFLLWSLFGFLFIPYYYARRSSALFSATELHGIKCEARIPARRLYWIYFLYVLILALVIAVFTGFAVNIIKGMSGATPTKTTMVFVYFVFMYLAFFMILALAGLWLLHRRVWMLVVGSIVILNPERLDEIAGRMLDGEGGFGAGFADAMDVGDFDVGF